MVWFCTPLSAARLPDPNISLLLAGCSCTTWGVSARAQACTSRLAWRRSSSWTSAASTGCLCCNTSARRTAVSRARARAASRSRGSVVGARRASCPVTPTSTTSTSSATPMRMATRRHLLLIRSRHKYVDTNCLFDPIHLYLGHVVLYFAHTYSYWYINW